ncbi:hypothetical protein [Hyalangium versicolor]|uniref:hypothetical protein n=1 Tax=Hyalangium versicolor TaxID=2861190 RepID=UPI001CCB4DA8|nr:hypothetical protein [Hyalangium versicolor]
MSSSDSALVTNNSLTPNGLGTNGLGTNGLGTNGLGTNGLSTASFASWFDSNPAALSDMVMRYLVRCAVPASESRTWTHPSTGVHYTWTGELGLTPNWASGQVASEREEQLITACLAAHVNKFGVSMQISVVGRDAPSNVLHMDTGEATTYSQQEATFYGNLFRNEGIFVCKDPHLKLSSAQSTLRACSLESPNSSCSPITITGTCGGGTGCIPDSTKGFYASCTYNKKTYPALSTRIRPQDIYKCGDGICQISESCGTGKSAISCLADCGPCP